MEIENMQSYTGLKTSPTVQNYPNFDPNADSEVLRGAMKGLGTDEEIIIDVLSKRTSEQRVAIAKQYKTMYGRDLIEDLKSELSGHFEDVVVAMMYTLDEFDARELRRAMKGAGTDEGALIEILCSRTNEQIQAIRNAYSQVLGRDLDKDIANDTSGCFKKVLISLAQGNRNENAPVNNHDVAADVQALFDAGENKWGTDESVFQRILVAKSRAHVAAVMRAYAEATGKPFTETLKSELSGNLLKSYLALAECIWDTPQYFARRLKDSMAGLGTNDRQLIRIVVSRCEIDMGEIKKRFREETGKTLAQWITDDTSGDYKKMLLALIE